jgi:hypothetical protein
LINTQITRRKKDENKKKTLCEILNKECGLRENLNSGVQ